MTPLDGPRVLDQAQIRREHGFHLLPVKEVVPETDDTRSFVLAIPPELQPSFRYRAGQFCTFRVRVDGQERLRCYSMSSAPEVDGDLTVTVKRVPGGAVSNWLNDHVSPGDALEATKPAGVFCVREGSHPVVAFCGGSGVTPVLSIAKSVLATSPRPVRVLYANRTRRSVIFGQELRAMASRYPERFELRHHFDSDGGYLDAGAIAGFATESEDADFYLCGPGPFMDLVETTLLGLGVAPERILIERFVAAPGPDASSVAGTAPGESGIPERVTLILRGKSHTVAYRPGDTLLQTARRASLPAPYSCESGNCATCMALLREGTATMRVNNALSPEEVASGWVLTCQAIPEGQRVMVEYEAL